MNPTKRDPLADHLFGADGADPSACPDPSLLARCADGDLDADERPAIEAHLLSCDTCSGVVAALGGAAASSAPRVAIRFLWPGLAAVAAIALIVVLFRLLGPEPPLAERLVAACRAHGFEPLSEAELRGGASPVLRGEVRAVRPRGRTLSTRPSFGWMAPTGTVVDVLVVAVARGEILWQRTANAAEVRVATMSYPSDEPSLPIGESVIWKVAPRGTVDGAEGVMFEVVTEAERRAFEKTLDAIERETPEDLRDFVAAHFALRRGYLQQAFARVYLPSHHRGEIVALALLNHIERRLGIPETTAPEHR